MASGDPAVCVLCQRSEENKITGALSSNGDVTAHQNCLLYSSGIFCRYSPAFDDLFGFSAEDVLSERQRGLKLGCSKCKKKGATVGCEVKRCKKSYHYPCAIQAQAQTFEDKKNGRFGLHCFHCRDKSKTVSNLSSDFGFDDLPSTSAHNPKRKLDFSDRQEEKNPLKRTRRILSDESTDSDATDAGEHMAPIESDLEENDNSAPYELHENPVLDGNIPVIAGAGFLDHPKEIQDTSLQNSEANGGQSNLQEENGYLSIDPSHFWSDCNVAGCAQAIFKDFIKEMTDIFNRITSEQASKQGKTMSTMKNNVLINDHE
ncbi:uncharacterized protein phf11 [Eucyclogobius newberryi]|uniref:uncharacterized protein phf11 n=1 Tax=Eucyclogobius newberryi TaxID=166745 RepID=UPI003B5B4061